MTTSSSSAGAAPPRLPNPDIAEWEDGRKLAADFLRHKADESATAVTGGTVVSGMDPREVFALMKCFVSRTPNGPMTFMIDGMPLDNFVWWDFVMRSGETLLWLQRTSQRLEVNTLGAPTGWDPVAFLADNIDAYRERIAVEIDTFEVHRVYANHYASYKQCMHWLKHEIDELDLEIPESPVFGTQEEIDKAASDQQRFVTESVKLHALGKALVLNSAFSMESLVNSLLRIGLAPPLRGSAELLSVVLRSQFKTRLKLLDRLTIIFRASIPLGDAVVRDALSLMTLRNKLAHSEESAHVRLDDVYFDGPFPLYQPSGRSPVIDAAVRSLHTPSFDAVVSAKDTAEQFCELVLDAVHPRFSNDVRFMVEQPQLGFNVETGVYSTVFPSNVGTAMFVTDKI